MLLKRPVLRFTAASYFSSLYRYAEHEIICKDYIEVSGGIKLH